MWTDCDDGVKLLAEHLAKSKLAAQEEIYKLKRERDSLRIQTGELKDALDIAYSRLQEVEAEAIMVKRENTKKYRIEERNDWQALVNALNKDRSRVQKENQELVEERQKLEAKIAELNLRNSNTKDDSLSDEVSAQLKQLRVTKDGAESLLIKEQQAHNHNITALRLENTSLKADVARLSAENLLLKEKMKNMDHLGAGASRHILALNHSSSGLISQLGGILRLCSRPPRSHHSFGV
eukprot:g4187.t1